MVSKKNNWFMPQIKVRRSKISIKRWC